MLLFLNSYPRVDVPLDTALHRWAAGGKGDPEFSGPGDREAWPLDLFSMARQEALNIIGELGYLLLYGSG